MDLFILCLCGFMLLLLIITLYVDWDMAKAGKYLDELVDKCSKR